MRVETSLRRMKTQSEALESKKKTQRLERKTIKSARRGIAVGKGSKTRVETEERACNQLVLLCVLK